ncbi:MAG: tetratricopeptide repeat protein [Dehalococcoidia bacterium]
MTMERVPGQPLTSRLSLRWSWRRIIWQVLPVAAIALGAFLLARGAGGGEATTSPSARVDPQYEQRLAANIEFFETRVQETHDSLSYNRLVSLYLGRLRLHGDTSDVVRAELAATKSLEVAPNAYSSVISMALVRLAQHDFEEVLTLAQLAQELRPNEPDALAIAGDANMALGRYDQAGRNYAEYLDKAPGFSAFSRKATYEEAIGAVDVAEQFWQAAIDSTRLDSPIDSAWARVQLGTLRAKNGDLKGAQSEFDLALKVFPGYTLADAGLAEVAAMRGDFDESLERFARVTASYPSPIFVAEYAEVAERAGETTVADQQAALMGALGQLFEANGIKNDLTLILFQADHGPVDDALVASAKAAYEARPSLAAADTYAWVLYRAGGFDEAQAYANEALHLGTKEPLYLFHAGMIAKARGDSAAAREHLEAALELNPNFHPLHAPEAGQELHAY